MPSQAAVAECHIKTAIERHDLHPIHEKEKSSMELWCWFFHIQMSRLLSKMQPRHEWATSSFWPELLLTAVNLAAGVGNVEYLTNCILLHNRLEHELAEMTNFEPRDQQTKTLWNYKTLHSSCRTRTNFRKQETSNATTWIIHSQTRTRHGLRFPGRTNDGGAAPISARWLLWACLNLEERHGIHFIVSLSTPPLPLLVTSSYPSQYIAALRWIWVTWGVFLLVHP